MYEQSSILKPELVAETYDLMPFEITTQTIERTLADKVFALCDYYMDGKMERHSRHLYDIHKIVESVGISGELSSLIPEVRAVRAELSVCPSAKPGVCVTEVFHSSLEEYLEQYKNTSQKCVKEHSKYEYIFLKK